MNTSTVLPDVGVELREGFAEVGDVSLHYVEAGDGPLIVLLHGFPEFWFGWRPQIAPLVAAGFRVVAPDTRGYNLSSKPEGFEAYSVDLLAADIRGLIEERGADSAHRGRDRCGHTRYRGPASLPRPPDTSSPGRRTIRPTAARSAVPSTFGPPTRHAKDDPHAPAGVRILAVDDARPPAEEFVTEGRAYRSRRHS